VVERDVHATESYEERDKNMVRDKEVGVCTERY
jgi:hypothetical protein